MGAPREGLLPSRHFLDGLETPPSEPLSLHAGPLSLLFEAGGLRYVRLGERELVRRIYCAVRDANWGTVPDRIENLQVDIRDDSFRLSFDVENRQGEIDFDWRGTIVGEPSGEVTFAMDGTARSTFRRNRIGFCILHPAELAGLPVEIRHADGSVQQSKFPRHIAPQNPFLDLVGMVHPAGPKAKIELMFEEDVFECEDQRNWIDASYKTFCTPLSRPFPAEVRAGQRIAQHVSISIVSETPESPGWHALSQEGEGRGASATAPSSAQPSHGHRSAPAVPHAPLAIALGTSQQPVGLLPKIGFALSADAPPLGDAEISRLRQLKPAHLRCELRLSGDFESALRTAAAMSKLLNAPLEAALFFGADPQGEARRLLESAAEVRPAIVRWLVFPQAGWCTSRQLASAVVGILRGYDSRIPVGGGSAASFCELNRNRPPTDLLDCVAWSMQPQEHAIDNLSLVETLAAHAAAVASARQFSGELPFAVGPITLKRRVNPYATGRWPPETPAGELPEGVDVRQLSLLGAGWTLGSVKYLAESGVASATYYELTGWKGLVERAGGSLAPQRFPSLPGGVFPLFHVFADLAEWQGAEVLPVKSSSPLLVEALALRRGGHMRMLLANFSRHSQNVSLSIKPTAARLRRLDESTVMEAMASTEKYRASDEPWPIAGGRVTLSLSPYALARVDFEI